MGCVWLSIGHVPVGGSFSRPPILSCRVRNLEMASPLYTHVYVCMCTYSIKEGNIRTHSVLSYADLECDMEMTGALRSDFVINVSDVALNEMTGAACIADLDSRHLTGRCEFFPVEVFCGDMSAYCFNQSARQQLAALTSPGGIHGTVTYDSDAKKIPERAAGAMVSNVGKPLLRLIGSSMALGLKVFTFGLPLSDAPMLADWEEDGDLRDTFDYARKQRDFVMPDDNDDRAAIAADRSSAAIYF